MQKTALVIMAAGIGSRFGGGVKQLAKVGPNGELIIDYSINDALKAGFDKIIFIIRKEIEQDFKEVIGDRTAKKAEVAYAFQSLTDLPEGFSVPEGRKKPWGTGQAVLAARDLIDCPFLVINADDYYGPEGFQQMHEYLVSRKEEQTAPLEFCMAGYVLANTLSENGTVTRGVCEEDENGYLKKVCETYDIRKENGIVTGRPGNGDSVEIPENAVVSMNMWGFPKEFLKELSEGFPEFLSENGGSLKAEYLLPAAVGKLVDEKKAEVKILHTSDKWFGVTYAEDKAYVMEALKKISI